MVGNPMHTEVSADASDYVSSLQTAINRTDELDQQAGQAARGLDRLGEDATSAAARLGAFSASAMGATASTRALSTATTASLVPALGALSTTVVPLTAALGGLAAAASGVAAGFTAVIGTGAYAYGEQLASQNEERLAQINEKIEGLEDLREETGSLTDAQQERLSSLKETRDEVEETTSVTGALSQEMQPVRDQLHETAMTLGSDFVPLIRDAIDAMPAFIRRMEEAIGPLQPFADALRDAGQVAFDLIPRITAVMMDMGRNALPAVRDLGSFIANNAVPALRGMGDTLGRVADLVPNLGGTLVEVIPKLNEFGLTVLETVVPAAKDAAATVMDLAGAFNELPEGEQKLAISGSIAAPALLFGLTKLSAIIPGVVAGLSALSPVATAAGAALGALSAPVIAIAAVLGALGAAALVSKEEIAEAVDGILEAFKPTFEAVNDIISESADEIEAVADSVMDAFDGLVNFFQTVLLPSIRFVFSKFIAPIVNSAMTAIANNVGPVLSEVSQTIDSLTGYATTLGNVMLDIWNEIDGVVVPIIKGVADIISTTIGATIDALADGLQLVMNLVQGDFGAAFENLKSMLSEGLSAALDVLGILKDGLKAAVSWLAETGKNLLIGAFGFLTDTEDGLPAMVLDGLAGGLNAFAAWLSKLPKKLVEAIASLASTIGDWIYDAVYRAVTLGLADSRPAKPGEQPGIPSGSVGSGTGPDADIEGESDIWMWNPEKGQWMIDPSTMPSGGGGGGGGGQTVDVRVDARSYVDQNGNWKAEVANISQQTVQESQQQQSRTSNSLHQNPGISK